MADIKKKLGTNLQGAFYVDSTCISCGLCGALAYDNFQEIGNYFSVYNQPAEDFEFEKCFSAMFSCPTDSIGYQGKKLLKNPLPQKLADNVYFLGHSSRKANAARSYLVEDITGNWMIDSPKFNPELVKKIAKMGGVKYIFITNRDNIADADRFAREFKARTIIHKDDAAALKNAEFIVDQKIPEHGVSFNYRGTEYEDYKLLHLPGRTAGSMGLLYKNKFLFVGGTIAWSNEKQAFTANKNDASFSWESQLKSVQNLNNVEFEWVLPSHGADINLMSQDFKSEIKKFIDDVLKNDKIVLKLS